VSWSWYSWQHFDPAVNNPIAAGNALGQPANAFGRQPEDIFVLHPYSLFNGQIGYESPDKGWSAKLLVTNLANHWFHYQVMRGTVNAQTRVGEPRTWSISVKKTF
jgi:outer membrane receptor for ferric coprogen and ferric-rhodotorulic acid